MRQYKNRLKSRADFPLLDVQKELEPVIYTGLEKEKNTYFFSDYFDEYTIPKLISDIESIRQSGSYAELDLYFQSGGGDVDMLMMLADYLNNLNEFKINILVNGVVASAGFFILLMVYNPDISIMVGNNSSAMVHLGSCRISSYALLRDESKYHHNYDSFTKKHIEQLNNEVILPMCSKLGLPESDVEEIRKGGEVWLTAEQLNEVIDYYADSVYYETQAEDDLALLSAKKEEYLNAIKELDKSIKEVKKGIKEFNKVAEGEGAE